ncbi:MAG: hypothetical protein DMF91_08350 [Acidobacteria bacterium]|nr:MAG: hypothetical protein DMF91_08350 [Acidobacteriota bacterium]
MVKMPRGSLGRWLLTALVIAQVAIILLIVRNWFYVTTYRLYLDQRMGDVRHSTAVQRFDVEGRRIVPQIVTRDRERIAFPIAIDRPSTIHVDVRAEDRARYELHFHRDGRDELLAHGDIASTASPVAAPVPVGPGVIGLVSDGALTWIDARVVRDLHAAPHGMALAVLMAVSLWLIRWRRMDLAVLTCPVPRVWFRTCALGVSVTFALLTLEEGLRLLGDRVPPGIAAERHDLGEVRRDSRWEDSPRYERRLRPNVDAVNQWRYGDIVRMGYIPATVSEGIMHRFRFRTDAEGFRNSAVRDRIEIAALGDSFTDAMTLPVDESWPSQLERRLGVPVQNYGTAGFGPQQEHLVLSDYVARHRPRFVVLAFFAGNDIFDAEAFDEFERSGARRAVAGWRIKDVVSRADTWFLVSALRAGASWVGRQEATSVAAETLEPPAAPGNGYRMTAAFDRGMFNVPAGDRELRCAFMPPYLNTLTFSQDDLAARSGWALTRRALAGMQQETSAFGGRFVVMFLPFKSQVYFPLLRRAFGREALQTAFQFYLGANPKAPDVEAMFRNRLAQNTLMRQFCEESRIPFLDVTDTLQAHVESGENVYFPDESHLNEAGQTIVADALAAFLRRR